MKKALGSLLFLGPIIGLMYWYGGWSGLGMTFMALAVVVLMSIGLVLMIDDY